MPSYETIYEDFSRENCLLLTSREEHEKLPSRNPKYRYIASCKHENVVFFNVFKHRRSGVVCAKCKRKEIALKQQESLQNNKLIFLEQELAGINYIKQMLNEDFFIDKAFDGCSADIILKPKVVHGNQWIGIQIKTTKCASAGYGFQLGRVEYEDILVLCICVYNWKMWAIPYEHIRGKSKVSIGLKKSHKYEKYHVDKNDIVEKMQDYYKIMTKFKYEDINKPKNIYQQREQMYELYRISKINFIEFKRNTMEGLVYDFTIENLRVQEKVGGQCAHRLGCFIFHLLKNNGPSISQYDVNDNDFYWLNCDNNKHFFVVPNQILIDHNYIGNQRKTKVLKVTPIEPSAWLQPYLFDYDNIDKSRILSVLYDS